MSPHQSFDSKRMTSIESLRPHRNSRTRSYRLRQVIAPLPCAPEPEEVIYQPRRVRRYPALLQLSETDCGAACLSMILRYYGKHVSINRLRDLANVSREGSTLYSVAEAAETLGFQSRGIRAAFEHLEKVELPAIAHWEGFHYIVLYEVTPH